MSLSYNLNADAIINNARKVFPDRSQPIWINDETILNEKNMTLMQDNINKYAEILAHNVYEESISKLNTSNKYDEYVLRACLEQIKLILSAVDETGIETELQQSIATCYNKEGIDKSTEEIYVKYITPEGTESQEKLYVYILSNQEDKFLDKE